MKFLKSFMGHEHLDSRQRGEGQAGFPGTYPVQFGGLNTGYVDYLVGLATAPESTIEIRVAKPAKFLSARERANPFLAAQGPQVEIYDQVMYPKSFLTQLLVTTNALVETWAFHLAYASELDLDRVADDRATIKQLGTPEMSRDAELAEGGETAYSTFTQDEEMPLYGFARRALARLTLSRALTALVAEVAALTPANAFDAAYLRREAEVDGDGDDIDDLDEVARARVMERRRVRRERREAGFVDGDDAARAAAAKAACLAFLKDFGDLWLPKLARGDPRSDLQKKAVRPPPGQREVRPEAAGADAAVALEALWAYRGEPAYGIRGGELVLPFALGVRLRELRAAEMVAAKAEIEDVINPKLLEIRLEYTDFTLEDLVSQGDWAGDEEAAYVWSADRSLGGD